MKFKLKVRNVIDSYTSGKFGSFYKVIWEPSWVSSETLALFNQRFEDYFTSKTKNGDVAIETNEFPLKVELPAMSVPVTDEKTSTCCFCGAIIPAKLLADHEKQHLEENDPLQPLSYVDVCVVINKGFAGGDYGCTHCRRRFVSKVGFRKHMALHKESQRVQKNLVNSRKNKDSIPPVALQAAKNYIKSFGRKTKDANNARNLVSIDSLSLPEVSIADGRHAYKCRVCGKVFYNKFHHREHYNVHSGAMPYFCEFCTKRFRQRSGWNRHIKLHHKYKVFTGPIPCPGQTQIAEIAETTESSNLDINKPSLIEYNETACGERFVQLGPDSTDDPSFNCIPNGLGPIDFANKPSSKAFPSSFEGEVFPSLLHTSPHEEGAREDCSRRFPSFEHTAEPQHKCLKTKNYKKQKRKALTPKHVKRVSAATVFACNFCSESFALRTTYLRHLNSKHRNSPSNHSSFSALDGLEKFTRAFLPEIKQEP